MTFDVDKEYNLSKQELADLITKDNHVTTLTNWVIRKNNTGFTKRQIYDVLLLLHSDIQKWDDPDDKIYDRLSDFLDRFTDFAGSPSSRILPDEPNV